MSETQLEKLRRLTLGAKRDFKSELVEYDGEKFEIRQPTIKARSELREKCTTISDDGVQFDMFEFLVWAVIHNTYVPDTQYRVFEDTDYEALVQNPIGGFMDQFSEVAAKLVNVETASKKKVIQKSAEAQLIFRVAETIGCRLSDIRETMTLDELHEWDAWFQLKHEAEERLLKEARKTRKR